MITDRYNAINEVIETDEARYYLPEFCYDWWYSQQLIAYYKNNEDIAIKVKYFESTTKVIYCPFKFRDHYIYLV